MELTKIDKNLIKKIAKKYDLNFLVLFGSQATGKTHKQSDVDIAYSAKKELNYRQEYYLTGELLRSLHLNPKIRTDLVDLNNVSPLLAKEVAFTGKLLAEITPHSFARFQMYAFKLFIESKPLFILKHKFITQNL